MNVLEKWNPFRFDRTATKSVAKKSQQTPAQAVRHPIATMEDEFNRMIERLWKEPLAGFADLSPWFGDFRPTLFKPVIDVTDEGDAIEVTAELPGMDQKDIELTVDEGVLVVRGTKQHREEKKEKGCYRLERSFGTFQRNIPLPNDLDVEHAEALFEKGVLKIRFGKLAHTEKDAPKKIPIKG